MGEAVETTAGNGLQQLDKVETWRIVWASYKTASEDDGAMEMEIISVKETYRRMEALYEKWRSGAKVECPEYLSHYLKGIVLNDYAHSEEDRELCIALTEAVIVLVCERLSNAPEEEVPYLELAVNALEKELGYYAGEGGELMGDNYEVLFQQGAKFYGWK